MININYTFTCTCGDVVTVEAQTRDEAVKKIQAMMTQDAINAHMADKHPGEPVPTKEQSDMMLEKTVQPAV